MNDYRLNLLVNGRVELTKLVNGKALTIAVSLEELWDDHQIAADLRGSVAFAGGTR